MDENGSAFRGMCDHAQVVYVRRQIPTKRPLWNHWLVCMVCEAKVVLTWPSGDPAADAAKGTRT